jgi:hypothetical protein
MSTGPARRILSAVPSERRNSRRDGTGVSSPVEVRLPDQTFTCFELSQISPGSFHIRSTQKPSVQIGQGDRIALEVLRGGISVINGTWQVSSIRNTNESLDIAFKRDDFELLTEYQNVISSDVFLKAHQYQAYNLAKAEDQTSVARHLAEIKDCPIPVQGHIKAPEGTVECTFDFSSEQKDLASIDFQIANPPGTSPLPQLVAGTEVTVDYTFLYVRYIFRARVKELDSDFGILAVTVPDSLIAISARRFDRYDCEVEVDLIVAEHSPMPAKLLQLSPSGGLLEITKEHRLDVQSARVICAYGSLDVLLSGKSSTLYSFQVDDSVENKVVTRRLLGHILPTPLKSRSSEHYEAFARLYQEVGYAPKGADEFAAWKSETFKNWAQQDEVLPGSCTGGFEEERITSSCGTLPLSSSVAYGHSFCMTKTLPAAGAFFTQMVHSLVWTELLDGITHYGGSYAKASGFTTRIHAHFEMSATPIHQIVLHTQLLFPHERQNSTDRLSLRRLDALPESNDTRVNRRALELLLQPHEALLNLHQCSLFQVLDENSQSLGYFLVQETRSKFTGADMFRQAWLLLDNLERDANRVCRWLRSTAEHWQRPLQLMLDEHQKDLEIYSGPDKQKSGFWTFTPKDQIGVLIGTMARAAYSILRKYGEDASDDIRRLN